MPILPLSNANNTSLLKIQAQNNTAASTPQSKTATQTDKTVQPKNKKRSLTITLLSAATLIALGVVFRKNITKLLSGNKELIKSTDTISETVQKTGDEILKDIPNILDHPTSGIEESLTAWREKGQKAIKEILCGGSKRKINVEPIELKPHNYLPDDLPICEVKTRSCYVDYQTCGFEPNNTMAQGKIENSYQYFIDNALHTEDPHAVIAKVTPDKKYSVIFKFPTGRIDFFGREIIDHFHLISPHEGFTQSQKDVIKLFLSKKVEPNLIAQSIIDTANKEMPKHLEIHYDTFLSAINEMASNSAVTDDELKFLDKLKPGEKWINVLYSENTVDIILKMLSKPNITGNDAKQIIKAFPGIEHYPSIEQKLKTLV